MARNPIRGRTLKFKEGLAITITAQPVRPGGFAPHLRGRERERERERETEQERDRLPAQVLTCPGPEGLLCVLDSFCSFIFAFSLLTIPVVGAMAEVTARGS